MLNFKNIFKSALGIEQEKLRLENEHLSRFIKWGKTPRLADTGVVVTQKMNGTNAQIFIDKERGLFKVGSRNRWLDNPKRDNFGILAFMTEHREVLEECLGDGRHYGEWCGPGIQNTEGFEQKTLLLFNHDFRFNKWPPSWLQRVPLLYKGGADGFDSCNIIAKLEDEGSWANVGFMDVEGIIIEFTNRQGVRRLKAFCNNGKNK